MAANLTDRILAFDIGGSHVTAALCRLQPLAVTRTVLAPLADGIASEDFLSLLHQLGKQLASDTGKIAGACVAFPGPFDYSNGISRIRHKLGDLCGKNLKIAIADRFSWKPERVMFLNDADAALLGEVACGAAQGASRAVGIMLGTGIGFAFARNAQLDHTAPLVPPDSEIYNLPFLDGIVEDALSSRALESNYEQRTGRRRPAAIIAGLAASDADAREVFAAFGCHLGQIVCELLQPLHPEVVVLGGGIARSSHLFLPAARNQVNGLGIPLVPSVLLEKAPLFGAARYWLDRTALPVAASPADLSDAK